MKNLSKVSTPKKALFIKLGLKQEFESNQIKSIIII